VSHGLQEQVHALAGLQATYEENGRVPFPFLRAGWHRLEVARQAAVVGYEDLISGETQPVYSSAPRRL